jgi:tRNA 2-thiocytidine biosynthesis protein TtcA
MPSLQRKRRTDTIKLGKRLRRAVGRAIDDYRMIRAGDRIMVCVSGGKDSFTLADMLVSLRRSAPVKFELVAVNLDQKHPGFPGDVLPDYFHRLGVPFQVLEQDTYSVVQRVIPAGQTQCSLCSRLRRGSLYTFAAREGFTKIALGHHRDDILETLLMNMFHGGSLKTMPPKLRSDDGRHVVIRPLAYCRERDIAAYAALREFPLIPCDLCGSEGDLERVRTRALLRDWETRYPGRIENRLRALQNVVPSHLLDKRLYDFASLDDASAGPRPDFLKQRRSA